MKKRKTQPEAESTQNILQILDSDCSLIIYRPNLNKITGNVNATILLQQIYHRWKFNGKEPIYKFKSPCEHKLYKKGDSWCEELGFSESEFDTALKKIASKTTKNDQNEGNKIVYYWTTRDRLTFYSINDIIKTNLPKQEHQVLVNQKEEFTKTRNKQVDYNTKITSKITSKINIYIPFLEKWNEQKITIHKKITSKKEAAIKKALKDYTQEEIFNAFQNYSTVLKSSDYYWDYTWTMEEFLKRGLDRFVDESTPLIIFKNKNFSNSTQTAQSKQVIQSLDQNHTQQSLNLFHYEKVDDFLSTCNSIIDQWSKNKTVWQDNYTPDKNQIFSAVVKTKAWINNIFGSDCGKVEYRLGTIQDVANEYRNWIEEQRWLDEPGKSIQNTSILFPESKMFKLFMKRFEENIMDTSIRSRGWGDDENLQILSPVELKTKEKKQKDNVKKKEAQKEQIKNQHKENITWAHECMEKHFSDYNKINPDFLEIDFLIQGDDWKQRFKNVVNEIEKQHLKDIKNRGNSYLYLFKKHKNFV